ncbi:hypothetical protein DCAR_0934954 [Daucus carota subsp. sativus]|uniref:Retrovirus-related Pol polyprotein from transposon TNT 1-94-like beta-barrel domain-containing protein n=1 Tax=Daucus carota subsp. sativus TaxID=79200 RepID=A0AAF0XWR5_DAUCS|nr:hypothetical protein DCAR_0934954 [Daucus carota subsp. sativus]
MMKLFNTQQASGGNNNNKMASFAGIILASNVVSIVKSYDKNTWIIDSGASDHMCGNTIIFHNLRSLDLPVKVGLSDGSVKIVDKMGDIKLSRRLTLYDVLYIDEFNHNLLSVSKLIKTSKINVMFDTKICILQDPSTKEIVGRGKEENGLYRIEAAKDEENQVGVMRFWRQSNNVVMCNAAVKLYIVHARLGHSSVSKMRHIKFCNSDGLRNFFCDACCVEKHHKLPFKPSNAIAKNIFDLVHVDLWGPYKIPSITGEN